MSIAGVLDETLRALIREVVREEVRAALTEGPVRPRQGNSEEVPKDGYISITRAARYADVAPGTLRRWIRTGRLPARRAGRVLRVSRSDLDVLMAQPRNVNPELAMRAQELLRRND